MCNSYFLITKISPGWYFRILLMSFNFEKKRAENELLVVIFTAMMKIQSVQYYI